MWRLDSSIVICGCVTTVGRWCICIEPGRVVFRRVFSERSVLWRTRAQVHRLRDHSEVQPHQQVQSSSFRSIYVKYISRESLTTRNVVWSRASVCLSVCLSAATNVLTYSSGSTLMVRMSVINIVYVGWLTYGGQREYRRKKLTEFGELHLNTRNTRAMHTSAKTRLASAAIWRISMNECPLTTFRISQ